MTNHAEYTREDQVTCNKCSQVIESPYAYVTTVTEGRYALYVCDNCGEVHKVKVSKG